MSFKLPRSFTSLVLYYNLLFWFYFWNSFFHFSKFVMSPFSFHFLCFIPALSPFHPKSLQFLSFTVEIFFGWSLDIHLFLFQSKALKSPLEVFFCIKREIRELSAGLHLKNHTAMLLSLCQSFLGPWFDARVLWTKWGEGMRPLPFIIQTFT